MPPSATLRESLITQGVRFLQHPNVQTRPMSERLEFLEKKGLTAAEISEVLKRAQKAMKAAASKYDDVISSALPKSDIATSKLAKASATTAMAGERLKDRVIFITGGAHGLGEIVAIRAAKEGAKVVIFDSTPENEAFLAKDNSQRNVLSLRGDLGSWKDIDKAVTETIEKFGRIDVFINCSSPNEATENTSLLDTTEKNWDDITSRHARSVFLGCKRAVQQMLTQEICNDVRGKIINITTHRGILPSKGQFVYSVNDAAIVFMSKHIAKEYANEKIICNSITVGVIDESGASNEDFQSKVLYGRLGRSLDVANAAVYLGSDEASYIQAMNFVVDGGMMAHL